MSSPKIRFKGFTDAWEQRKVSDVAEITAGGTPDTKIQSYWNPKEIPWLSSGEVHKKYISFTDNMISVEGMKNSSAKVIKENSVLIALAGQGKTRGTVAINRISLTTNQSIAAMTFDENFVPEFVFSNLENRYEEIRRMSSGDGSRGGLNKQLVGDIEIPYTSKQEQIKIGSYFSTLDHLITLHQRKCEETKTLKKYMLQKMFPQDGECVPEIRFSGFTDAWEQRKLSEIATMHARIGWQNLRTSEFLDSGEYMLITGTDFEDGAINYDTCHYVERERYEQDKHIQIKNGSILITKDGTLGKVAYVQGLTMPATLNAGVFNVEIIDENEVDNKYLFQYLKAPFLMDYVAQKATGGTIKHLNQNILVEFPILLPSKSEQDAIGEYFMKLDHLITLHQRKCEELQNIKKFMLQNMFV
jgi:type I restriction enzyme S subunit